MPTARKIGTFPVSSERSETAPATRILIVRHMRSEQFTYGGQVYTSSILQLVRNAYDDVVIDELFATEYQPPAKRRLLQMLSIVKSVFSRYPAKVIHFKSAAFTRKLRRALAQRPYHLVMINGIDVLWCLDHIPPKTPILYISHNVEHCLYRQQTESYRRLPVLNRIFESDVAKLRRFELENVPRTGGAVTISAEDERYFRRHLPTLPMTTITPSFDYPRYRRGARRPASGAPLALGFLGNVEWWPNRDSILWFIDTILPHVPDRFRLHVYGKGSEKLDRGERVVGHGFVASLDEVWENVDVAIQPMIRGAGVNIKVAETIYNGLPMLATPMAVRGLPLLPDPAIRVLDTPSDWIEFLNGDEAPALAARAIRPENAEIFALEHNSQKIKTFVEELARNHRARSDRFPGLLDPINGST